MDLLSVVRRLIESKNSEHENSLEMYIPFPASFPALGNGGAAGGCCASNGVPWARNPGTADPACGGTP